MNSKTKQHSDYCKSPQSPYFSSGCEFDCDYYIEAVQNCKDEGEHFRRTTPVGGYDVCFNCGVKS